MQTKTGILFLQKDKFQLYSPYLPNILEFRFVPELIHDFDLINKELLDQLIKVFVVNNKIPASGLLMVIADNASFIKDFILPPPTPQNYQQPVTPPPSLEDLQGMANQYLEHVPFELVVSKTFPLANGIRAYATNQEIYEAIKSVLEKHGFIIQGVIPAFAFGQDIANKSAIDGISIGIILQKLSMVRGFNLLKDSGTIPDTSFQNESSLQRRDEEPEPQEFHVSQSSDEKGNKKMVLAIGISAIAIVIIITGFILYSQFTATPYKPSASTSPAAAAAAAAPSPVPVAPTTASTQPAGIVAPTLLTVQIIDASASAAKAASVRTAFAAHNFKSITEQTQEALSTAQGLVIFSPRVGPDVRASVTAEVKKVLGDVLIQDKADASFDIVVILGK